MKITRLIISLACVLSLISCSYDKVTAHENEKTTKNIKVNDFNEIKISNSAEIHFRQADTTSVILNCDAADMDRIIIKNEGNTLVIKQKDKGINLLSSIGDIELFITSPNLRGVAISGSANFEAENNIDTDRMKIQISGSGSVNLNKIICNHTGIIITGSGNTDIEQLICGAATTKITGSGGVDIEKIQADNGQFTITGSGKLDINNAFINNAKCIITGSGDININGKVKALKRQVTGSGEININN